MIDFGKWAFANRKLVYFVVAVLLVGGILSAYDMSKLEDPRNQGQAGDGHSDAPRRFGA